MSKQGEIILKMYDDEGEEVEHTFPSVNEVCPRCEGFGTHLTPSIGQHAYSQEEFYESFADEEDREQYFKRGGIYDVTCEECKGNKVVPVVDERHLTEDQKKVYKEWQEYQEEVAREDAYDRRTRYMESGGYDY
jgi:RecJ-like exonuclease